MEFLRNIFVFFLILLYEIKTTVTEMKKAFTRHISRLDKIKKWLSEIEVRNTTKTKNKTEKD